MTELKTAEELEAEERAEEEQQTKKEETAQETTEKMADNAANPDPVRSTLILHPSRPIGSFFLQLKPVKVATADFNNAKEDNPEQTNESDEEKTIKSLRSISLLR